jgi:phosphoserine phosphatase
MPIRARDLSLVAFDLDGTLTVEKSSWQTIHKSFGTEGCGEGALREYELGKINYEEFMRRDIACWPKDLKIDSVERILSTSTLRVGAADAIKELRGRGMKVVVITSGLASLARRACRSLGIEDFAANDLETDAEGRLNGKGIVVVDPFRKDLVLEGFMRQMGIRREQTVAVGDTKFDKSLLGAAAVGLAFADDGIPDPGLMGVADYVITELSDVVLVVDHLNRQQLKS